MNEKMFTKKELIIKLSLFVLFICYWIFTIIDFVKSDARFMSVLLKVFILLPLTFVIGLSIYRYGPLFLLVYSVYICLISGIAFFDEFRRERANVLEIISTLLSCLFGLNMIITSIRLLRNKDNIYRYLIMLFGITIFILNIITFFVFRENGDSIISLIASNILLLMQIIFYVNFPKLELSIFERD